MMKKLDLENNVFATNKVLQDKIITQANKTMEEKRAMGWRYVNATPTLKVFVPCDKNGNPTEEGKAKIAKWLKIC